MSLQLKPNFIINVIIVSSGKVTEQECYDKNF
jgi:hypothetical protein